jgi:hypothetical protein
MNYRKILILSLFICVMSCFLGCDKRNKLTSNTMILQIDPPVAISCNIGDAKQLKAIVRNSAKEEVDEPVKWSVSPVGLVEFVDSTGSNKVTFIAKQAGEGKISLSCQGVVTSIDVKVS